MTSSESRRHIDGFGLAIMLIGYGLGAFILVLALMTLFGVRSGPTPPLAFQALVLIALGSGLRMLVRIDKRLEGGKTDPAANPD